MASLQENSFQRTVSLKQAALVSAFGILAMVLSAPLAEMYILPKLMVFDDPTATFNNISEQRGLFTWAIFLYTITFLADIVVAWSLYLYFKPYNKQLSLLTGWFRLVYGILSFAALFNLIKALRWTKLPETFSEGFTSAAPEQLMFALRSYGSEWSFSLILFGIYLLLLGYMAYKTTYVPKFIGVLLLLAGGAYFVDGLRPYFFPELDTTILFVLFFGELIFMVWLFVKGWRVQL